MLIAFLAAIVGFVFFMLAGHSGWLGVLVGACVGGIITLYQRVGRLEERLEFLQKALAKDWEERQKRKSPEEQHTGEVPVSEEPVIESGITVHIDSEEVEPPSEVVTTEAAVEAPRPEPDLPAFEPEKPAEQVAAWDRPVEVVEKPESPVVQWVRDYFTTGNLFVRIGVLVLFFGVAFLLKYAVDNQLLPIEYRLIGASIGGIALLVTGWRLKERPGRETYGLLLQGAGVGILYMVVYAAFALYSLIPAVAAFALLVAVSLFSVVLAVRQDSLSFAVFSVTGGFLAPILASTGEGNYIILFSYYLVLDILILLVARYRSWRLLNLVGFAFTFIIATAWGVLRYSEEKFATTEPFLLGFFLIYVVVAVLHAGKGTLKIRKPLDGTLLLGNPLATFALQAGMVQQFEYGLAWSAFGFGLFYLVLAKLLWRRGSGEMQLLTEVFLALGVVFASLAIPFALDPQLSAAAWAVEGAGVLWIATRQNQLAPKIFSLILLAGASLLFISDAHVGLSHTDPLLNSFLLGTSLLGLAWLFSAWLLRDGRETESQPDWEGVVSNLLLAGGLVWWLGGALVRFATWFQDADAGVVWLLYLSASMLLLFLLSRRFDWRAGRFASLVQLPGLLLMLLGFLADESHPFVEWAIIAWPVGIAVLYWLIKSLETSDGAYAFRAIPHAGAFFLVLFLAGWEGEYQLSRHFANDSPWIVAWYAVPLVAGLRFTLHWSHWPATTDRGLYGRVIPLVLAALLVLWGLASSLHPGGSEPLPYVPLLNPVDLVLLAAIATIASWLYANRERVQLAPDLSSLLGNLLLVLAFVWLNVTMFRVMHHWFGYLWDLDGLLSSSQVQMAMSILWAVTGVVAMVVASRRDNRTIWLGAAGLLIAVVVKLFLVDLAATGTIARIFSFLVVGGLLILVGYLSPLPPKKEAHESASEGESS